MTTTYHLQNFGPVTFIAKKERQQWTEISVALTSLDGKSTAFPALGGAVDFDFRSLDPHVLIRSVKATPFQRQVWAEIYRIAPGRVASYSELAALVGRPKAFRAVANACGANRFAGVIPCHRVVGTNGNIGCYRWGQQVKEALLAFEKSV